MITQKNLYFFAAGAIIVLLLWFATCNRKDPAAPVIIPPKEIVKQVEKKEDTTTRVVDSLYKELFVASDKIMDLTGDLKDAQAKARIMETALENKYSNADKVPATNDYTNGDLPAELRASKINSQLRDSLCNESIYGLGKMVSDQDQIIKKKDMAYTGLRTNFDLAIDQNEKLIKYTGDLGKQVKNKKIGSVVWKIVAGIGFGLFINEKLK